jgi:hypothetical protein
MKPTPLAFVVSLALALAASSAAAEPSPAAQSRMAAALDACSTGLDKEGDAASALGTFRQARDEAAKIDPSILSWAGQLHGLWVVRDWVPKCERELPAKVEQQRSDSTALAAYLPASDACMNARNNPSDASLAKYKQTRAALAAATGNAPKLSLPARAGAADEITRCDAELPGIVALAAKKAADQRKETEYLAKDTADRAKVLRDIAAIMASLRGDRRAIAKERGAPADLPYSAITRAPKWTYYDSVPLDQVTITGSHGGSAIATRTAPCTVTFTFRGDKKLNVTKVGPGCVND